MRKKVTIRKGKSSISLYVKTTNFISRGTGLTFKRSDTANLIFEFNRKTRLAITSLFVFFPFLAIWLDDKNKVVEARIVEPFVLRVVPKKAFYKLVEVPINDKNRKVVDFFVGKQRKV